MFYYGLSNIHQSKDLSDKYKIFLYNISESDIIKIEHFHFYKQFDEEEKESEQNKV